MGWLWGDDSNKKPSGSDPLGDLDPSLREFLQKESPIKYQPAPAAAPSPSPATKEDAPDTSTSENPPKPLVPPESLFPDGRYAHLWKTYRPQAELEEAAKSPQEKLQDIFDAYKDRKAHIGRVAMENCIFEQEAIDQCMGKGTLMERLQLCRTQNQAFDRCFTMQSRFLKALGYMSTYDRPASVEEDIQMHADTLYQRMLERERATEAAKAAGKPAPAFEPLLSTLPINKELTDRAADFREKVTATANAEPAQRAQKSIFSRFTKEEDYPPLSPEIEARLSPSAVQNLRKRTRNLSPMERELEGQALVVEAENAAATGAQIKETQKEWRRVRRENGQGRGALGDWIVKHFGWDPDEE